MATDSRDAIALPAQGPPRSFPCSFCGREFRNAQALGGHMNVHRRERNLAKDLMQLRNHGTEPEESPPPSNSPPVHVGSQDAINNMQGDFCAGSSSSSSSPPSQASTVSFANSLGYSVGNLPSLQSRDSVDRAVDLELRLGHPPEM